MGRYILTRLLVFIPTLFAITFLVFALGYYGPGDPVKVILGQEWDNFEQYQAIREAWGLDRPFLVQYFDFLGRIVRLDFGYSILQAQRPIRDIMLAKLPISIQMGLVASGVLVVIGVTMGTLAAYKQNTWLDYIAVSGSIFAHAVPAYAMAPILLTIFVLKLNLVPVGYGWHGLLHKGIIIPVALLAAGRFRAARAWVAKTVGADVAGKLPASRWRDTR